MPPRPFYRRRFAARLQEKITIDKSGANTAAITHYNKRTGLRLSSATQNISEAIRELPNGFKLPLCDNGNQGGVQGGGDGALTGCYSDGSVRHWIRAYAHNLCCCGGAAMPSIGPFHHPALWERNKATAPHWPFLSFDPPPGTILFEPRGQVMIVISTRGYGGIPHTNCERSEHRLQLLKLR